MGQTRYAACFCFECRNFARLCGGGLGQRPLQTQHPHLRGRQNGYTFRTIPIIDMRLTRIGYIPSMQILQRSLSQISPWRFLVAPLCLFLVTAPSAKPGDLDLTFGAGTGKVLISAANMYEHEAVSTFQPDGKLLVGGICRPTATLGPDRTCISRFMPNGDIDTSFATAGTFVGKWNECAGSGALALLPSGEIMFGGVVGQTGLPVVGIPTTPQNSFCVSRLSRDGLLDSSFGQSGIASIYIPNTAYAQNSPITLSQLSNSRLLISGSCVILIPRFGDTKICAARIFSDGGLDTTFADNGSLIFNYATKIDFLSTVTVTDESIFFTGFCATTTIGTTNVMCITATDLNGVISAPYSVAGRASILPTGFNTADGNELLAFADGSALVAGSCTNSSGRRGCLVKLLANGSSDTAFATNGIVLDWSPYAMSGMGALLFSRDQTQIIMSGRCGASLTVNSPCLWRMSSGGVPDASFGSSGVVKIEFSPTVKTFGRYGTHQQSNGKIVSAASCVYSNGDEDFCITRLLDKEGYFDIDGDNQTRADTDGLLFVRHLLGFRDLALTKGVLGTLADRSNDVDIATYLSTPNTSYPNCSANIVGAPAGSSAMLDGIILLRAMIGLTGNTVTSGLVFPHGALRVTWNDIKSHLNTNCGMAWN